MTAPGDAPEAGSASASCRVRMVLDRIGDKWAIYVVDRDNLGKYHPTGDQIWQEIPNGLGGSAG